MDRLKRLDQYGHLLFKTIMILPPSAQYRIEVHTHQACELLFK